MEEAIRYNQDKLDFTILPWEVVGEVVKVFEFGALKYERDNYKKGDGLPLETYHQSAMRHMVASMNGEELDPESRLDHMAHVAANALMYLWQKQHQKELAESVELMEAIKRQMGVLQQIKTSTPEMIEGRCKKCDFPFIKPYDYVVSCPNCGALHSATDLTLAATKEQPAQRLGKPTSGIHLTPFGECLRILRDLTDLQNDAPLEQHRKEWEATMKEAYEFLEKWDDLP